MTTRGEIPGAAAAGTALIASGLGDDTGGGLYALGRDGVDLLDRLSTTGIAVSGDGRTLTRLLWTDDDPQSSAELLAYDGRGALTYRRVDEIQEPHGLAWHGDELAAVSTLGNRIVWLDAFGAVRRTWEAPGVGDCWHINSLVVRGGRLLASAFGRFDRHRGWAAPGARAGSGMVFDVESGEDLIRGLTCPHDPTPYENGWLVCDSGNQELLVLSARGEVERRIALGGWTRGLAYDDDLIYVGISAHRQTGADGRARVVALDRRTFAQRRSWALPCQEVYGLAFVPAELLGGVRTGLATNPVRLREGATIDSGAVASVGPLSEPDRAVDVTVRDGPATAVAGDTVVVRYAVRNRGDAVLVSVGDFAVLVGARWIGPAGEVAGVLGRARLPHAVGPGAAAEGFLRIPAPPTSGRYELRIAAGQDNVGWLDEVGAGRGWRAAVTVHDGGAPPRTRRWSRAALGRR